MFSTELWIQFRNTLRISIPLIITNIAQIALGLIDSAMVGAINYKQLAAASLATNLIAIPFTFCIGITIAVSILTGIARGRNNPEDTSRTMFSGAYISTIVAVIIAGICFATIPYLHYLKQDAEVTILATPYYKIMLISLVPITLFLSLKHFSDGLELTRTGMLLGLFSLPLNAALNYILIFGHFGAPRLELYGAGIATLITRILMLLAMVYIIMYHSSYKIYRIYWATAWRVKTVQIKEMLKLGIPSSLQLILEAGAFAVSGIMIGWLGATPQAAHQIALSSASATFMAVLGLSLGASIRISHAYGSGNVALQRAIGKSTIYGGFAWGVFCLLLFAICRHWVPLIFNNNPLVVELASGLLLVAAIFQVSDSLQAIGSGLLRGIKDVKTPTIFVAVAYWVIGIPFGYYLGFKQGFGAYGIWWGFVAGLSVSAVLLNIRFFKKTRSTRL